MARLCRVGETRPQSAKRCFYAAFGRSGTEEQHRWRRGYRRLIKELCNHHILLSGYQWSRGFVSFVSA